MPEKPTERVAVILQRQAIESPWQSHEWTLHAVIPDVGGEVRTIRETPTSLQRVHPGFEVTLHRDEAEGYHLNATSEEPSAFVSIRADEGAEDPYPFMVTLSYNEAARWMDSNERVERVAIWRELAEWLARFAAEHYKPEPRKRQRPRSFAGKEGVLRAKGDQ